MCGALHYTDEIQVAAFLVGCYQSNFLSPLEQWAPMGIGYSSLNKVALLFSKSSNTFFKIILYLVRMKTLLLFFANTSNIKQTKILIHQKIKEHYFLLVVWCSSLGGN